MYFDNSIFQPSLSYYNGGNATLISEVRPFYFSDNILLIICSDLNASLNLRYSAKGSFKGLYANLTVDINGPKTKPNKFGKDLFEFVIDKSGQVIPMGSSTYAWLFNIDSNEGTFKYTSTNGLYSCNETTVTTGWGCAGSIFENNFKVIYQ